MQRSVDDPAVAVEDVLGPAPVVGAEVDGQHPLSVGEYAAQTVALLTSHKPMARVGTRPGR